MSTHNIGFYKDFTKIIFQLSSNAHLISSSGHVAGFPTTDKIRIVNEELGYNKVTL